MYEKKKKVRRKVVRKRREELFKESNKTQKTPEGVERAKEGEIDKMLKEWRNKIEEVIKELKGMKTWKEELRQIKEKVREEIKKSCGGKK